MYDTTIAKRIKETTILSFAYQWLGKKTQVIACDKRSEKKLLTKLHKILDEAEIVVAHNGDSFDIKKINARFIIHKFKPPSPYLTIDTKKEVKKIASFDSHSLENLSIDMGEGEKIKHRGIDMWWGCMTGVIRDWKDMKRYNARDVDQLKKIYLRLRHWMKRHPLEFGNTCRCGSKEFQNRGTERTKTATYKRRQCKSCGAWGRGERC